VHRLPSLPQADGFTIHRCGHTATMDQQISSQLPSNVGDDPSAGSESVGDEPLSDVVGRLSDDGFDGQFRSVEGGRIQCLTCRQDFPAQDAHADQVTRIEGESDPADMAMVVPVRCPSCGASGSLILRYGPDASAADADVLVLLPRTPNEARAGTSSPGREPGFVLDPPQVDTLSPGADIAAGGVGSVEPNEPG